MKKGQAVCSGMAQRSWKDAKVQNSSAFSNVALHEDTLQSHALAYAARGWAVFPLQARGKLPLTPHGFKDATTDEALITQWWTRWPNANIGIATGGLSGIVVVDIDGERGQASFGALAGEHETIETLVSETGGGGYHLIFDAGDEAIRNSQSTIGPGIDTRGDGGYIVAPPSVHPTGALYQWTDADAPIAALPDWLRPENHKPTPAPARTVSRSAPVDDRLDRARAYLGAMPAAIQGLGGHNALFAAATAIVHGFELSKADALALLWADFNPRCSPPWNEADPKDRKDFERKVDQAERTAHSQPRGYLANAASFTQDAEAIEHGGAILASILGQRGPAVEVVAPNSPIPANSPKWSAKLLQPAGDLGRLVGWITSSAWKPQPILALANAITFAGALMGRKVATETDLRTNVYAVGVARSGAGKDHSRKCIKNLAAAAGIAGQLLGGEDVTSDAAIMKAVKRSPSCLFQFDEIGHMIASTKAHNAATHTRAIPVMLTKLFTSANSIFLGKEYAGEEREREDVEQPNACLYGTTVPSTFYAGLTEADIRDGFLGRLLVFKAPDKEPLPTDAPPTSPPAALVEWAKSWWNKGEAPGNLPNGTKRPEPIIVPMQPDAKAIVADFREYCQEKRGPKEHESIVALWARAEEHARKLALIYACSSNFEGATIDRAAMEWACELVTLLMADLVDSIGAHVAENQHEATKKRILDTIRKAGGTMTQYALNRATQSISSRDRSAIINDLVTDQYLTVGKKDTGGKPAVLLQLTDYKSAA